MSNQTGEIVKLVLSWATPLILIAIVTIRFVQQSRRRRSDRRRSAVAAVNVDMRRKNRAITDPGRIDDILASARVCRIALSVNDVPYIVPLNFGQADLVAERMGLDGTGCRYVAGSDAACRFYFHAADEGRKLDMARLNPRVCFEVEGRVELLAAPDPCDWSVSYESVVGFGVLSVVTDDSEKRRGLECIMRHQGETGELAIPDSAIDRTTVLRLDLTELTGKANRPAPAES